ncbi:hypothetical protein DN508_37175, partial [Burkholderia multivorans]
FAGAEIEIDIGKGADAGERIHGAADVEQRGARGISHLARLLIEYLRHPMSVAQTRCLGRQ